MSTNVAIAATAAALAVAGRSHCSGGPDLSNPVAVLLIKAGVIASLLGAAWAWWSYRHDNAWDIAIVTVLGLVSGPIVVAMLAALALGIQFVVTA